MKTSTENMSPAGPTLNCPPLPIFEASDWNAVAAAFAHSPSIALTQSWLEKPEPAFQPATARTGWRDNALWVFAEMNDLDIFNSATRLNEDTWETGDVFEMFLRPLSQEIWFEFHVTPENQQLQLRWPGGPEIFEPLQKAHGLQPFYLENPNFVTRTQVLAEQNRWRALARLPASLVFDGANRPINESDWIFSFCRYDTTRGQSDAVLSSTSPYTKIRFDRQQEWGTLHFTD